MNTINKFLFWFLIVTIVSCIEEIPLETQTTFDEILVIESIITNELKPQIVKLSKSYKLEEDGPSPVSGASVKVIDDLGNMYSFFEINPGTYRSVQSFAAVPNVNYTLEVIDEGITYSSSQESFLQPTQIDELYIDRDFNENNQEGVSIYVDTYDPTGNSKYYRYTYEETYKIIAPKYSPLDLLPGSLELVLKEEQQQICYATNLSNTIIQETTNPLNEDRLTKFRVHFVNRNNAIISHRYSILVTQYVQSARGYQFYKTLSELSAEGNLFSQLQAGFLEGNMSSEANTTEAVIGYFEVSAVNSKRIFFNYVDLFPGEFLPPYFISCNEFAPPIQGGALDSALTSGFKYFLTNETPTEFEGPYFLVPLACGNCTVLGSTNIPDFWVE